MSTSQYAPVGLAGLGLVIALYLTLTDLTRGAVPLACSSGGVVNCEQVTTSPEATVGPVPVAVLGVAWFSGSLAATVLVLATGTRGAWLALTTSLFATAWALGGLGFVFHLVYVELFEIGAICLWCTAIHLLVAALFVMHLGELVERLSWVRADASSAE
jgi:uncharacterized membrane protein